MANQILPAPEFSGNPTTEPHSAFVEGLVSAEYMPVDRAVYILDDMSGGQLYVFDPREFTRIPAGALTLTGAALTLFHAISQRGLTEWSSHALRSMWSVRSCIKELAHYVPTAVDYLHAGLIGEVRPPVYIARSLDPLKRRERARPGYVYVLRSPTGAFKIGYASDPADRLRTFTVKLPFEVEYELLIKTDDMRGLEAELHEYHADKRINGEWFALDANDLAELRKLDGAQ